MYESQYSSQGSFLSFNINIPANILTHSMQIFKLPSHMRLQNSLHPHEKLPQTLADYF